EDRLAEVLGGGCRRPAVGEHHGSSGEARERRRDGRDVVTAGAAEAAVERCAVLASDGGGGRGRGAPQLCEEAAGVGDELGEGLAVGGVEAADVPLPVDQ